MASSMLLAQQLPPLSFPFAMMQAAASTSSTTTLPSAAATNTETANQNQRQSFQLYSMETIEPDFALNDSPDKWAWLGPNPSANLNVNSNANANANSMAMTMVMADEMAMANLGAQGSQDLDRNNLIGLPNTNKQQYLSPFGHVLPVKKPSIFPMQRRLATRSGANGFTTKPIITLRATRDLHQQQQQQQMEPQSALFIAPNGFQFDLNSILAEESGQLDAGRLSRAYKPKIMSTARGFGK